MIMFFVTSLLLVAFQVNIKTTTATRSKTIGQMLDESLQQCKDDVQRLTKATHECKSDYQTLKRDIQEIEEALQLSSSSSKCSPCKVTVDLKNTGLVKLLEKNICDCSIFQPRKDCLEFYQHGQKTNGVYRLNGNGSHTFRAFCDQTTDGGGWTVFQRRQDPYVDFSRNWEDYKEGFGNLEASFWLGNEHIHDLTKPSFAPNKSQLLINMNMKGKPRPEYVKYDKFEITNEASQYTLKISDVSGNVTAYYLNGLDYNNNMKFSTYDSDNDTWHKGNCATKYFSSGWWYNDCTQVLLNGLYELPKFPDHPKKGYISWHTFYEQPDYVEMKLRRNV